MKISVAASDLAAALGVGSKAVGKDSSLPVMETVLVEASPDGGLRITGTNQRLRTWRTVPCVVEAAGAACMAPRVIDGFLDAIPDEAIVDLVVDARHKAVLTSGSTTVRSAGVDPEGFPPGPSIGDDTAELTLPAASLKALVEGSAFAADPKPDSSVYKECVHIVTRDGRLIFEATDTLRLARCSLAVDALPELDVLVPAGVLKTAATVLAGGKGPIRLIATPRHLLIESVSGSAALLRVEARFPQADRIIPTQINSMIRVPRTVLKRALKLVKGIERVAVGYRVDIEASDGTLCLRASDRSSDHEARTEVAIELTGEPVAVVLTAPHLDDALDALDAYETVEIALTSPSHPVLVRGVGDADGSQTHVLMPILAARK